MTREEDKPAEPVTVEQIGAALAALGLYDGSNTASEHAAEAARLGGADAYRVRLVNALLGAVQTRRCSPMPSSSTRRPATLRGGSNCSRPGP